MEPGSRRKTSFEVDFSKVEQAKALLGAGLTVFHYDADFDRIAQVTDQPMQWVVARGTVA